HGGLQPQDEGSVAPNPNTVPSAYALSSGDCYRITPGIMAGIIAVDMFLTVLLLIPVYCILGKLVPSSSPCEKRGRQKAEIVSGEKCEMQMLWVQGIKET
uniref:DNAX-activation protein 10 n=1 Tax=Varanus komodoensis TaxID=61221 RepID=A0A8D2JBM8_VARKO